VKRRDLALCRSMGEPLLTKLADGHDVPLRYVPLPSRLCTSEAVCNRALRPNRCLSPVVAGAGARRPFCHVTGAARVAHRDRERARGDERGPQEARAGRGDPRGEGDRPCSLSLSAPPPSLSLSLALALPRGFWASRDYRRGNLPVFLSGLHTGLGSRESQCRSCIEHTGIRFWLHHAVDGHVT
jgi:hypothetical protein